MSTVQEIETVPATMRAAVYRGVNDVRVETIPVPEIGAWRSAGQDPHLRNLRDGPEEDSHRIARRTAGLRPRDGGHDRPRWRGRHWFRSRRSRDGLPPHSVRRLLLLPQADLRAVRGLQEGGMHCGLCSLRRRLRRVHPRDGLDRAARPGEDSRRDSVRAGCVSSSRSTPATRRFSCSTCNRTRRCS